MASIKVCKEEENTLVVTHSGVIMTLMSYVYDTPFEDMARHYKMGNAKIVQLDGDLFYQRYSQLHSFNKS